jgi:xanthine dehydrogenase accessory factor
MGRSGAVAWGVQDDFTISLTAEIGSGWRYREMVKPPCALWIAGSGHVAQALAPLALQLDFRVTIFDDRPALANHERFPAETNLAVGDWADLLQRELPEEPCFGAIMTRGHQHDALVLSRWIQRPFAFLAMIGSRRKRRIICEQLVADQIATEERLAEVACPAGIDIGAVSVPEIALSIAGQLVQKRAEQAARGVVVSVP